MGRKSIEKVFIITDYIYILYNIYIYNEEQSIATCARCASGKVSEVNEECSIGHWRKGDPCCVKWKSRVMLGER